jgi:GNAT superfamily N-acetyltransferase
MIRKINRFDFEEIVDIMLDFADATNMKGYRENELTRESIKKVLLRCEIGGISLCSTTEEGRIQGVILSLRDRDLWIPTIIRLRELAWWVRPEYRNTTVGARLFHAYTKAADELISRGEIVSYTISKMNFSPDLDYERRGFRFLESTYIVGE